MKLISTIIPVYNTAKFLCRCLDSLIAAQPDELENEIILVNDGSTDNSLTLCQQYADKYNCIKVYSQNNQGPSAARNLGIKMAQGKWITFVDSDDWVDANYFSLIINYIDNYPTVDVFVYNYYKSYDTHKSLDRLTAEYFKVLSHRDVLSLLRNTYDSKFLLFTPNKVYARSVCKENFFYEDLSLGEDTLFNLKAVLIASTFCSWMRLITINTIMSCRLRAKSINQIWLLIWSDILPRSWQNIRSMKNFVKMYTFKI